MSEIAVANNTHTSPVTIDRRTRRTYGKSRLSARTMEASIAMRDQRQMSSSRRLQRAALIGAIVALAAAVPTVAEAQYNAPSLSGQAVGENYHVELAGTIWNPTLTGVVSSEQFGILGSDLDFVNDLGFQQTRFRDFELVLRPARKHRLRLQYTPIQYTAQSTLHRTITFNGQSFTASLPITSEFDWKVWRFGYEYDMVYRSRGFVGVFVEGRYTEFASSLASTSTTSLAEFTSAKAPLPAIGLAARGYVLPNVAINFEVGGMKLPNALKKYQANYYDWNIDGTVNLTNNFGLQVGWRRMTTMLAIEHDKADFKFQGMWFGAAVRY